MGSIPLNGYIGGPMKPHLCFNPYRCAALKGRLSINESTDSGKTGYSLTEKGKIPSTEIISQ